MKKHLYRDSNGEVVIEDYSLQLDQKDYFTSTKQDANI